MLSVNVLDKVQSDHSYMVLITCKKCKESIYLTPHASWNITDFGAKCEKCETVNTITLEKENLKYMNYFEFFWVDFTKIMHTETSYILPYDFKYHK